MNFSSNQLLNQHTLNWFINIFKLKKNVQTFQSCPNLYKEAICIRHHSFSSFYILKYSKFHQFVSFQFLLSQHISLIIHRWVIIINRLLIRGRFSCHFTILIAYWRFISNDSSMINLKPINYFSLTWWF